MKEVLIDGESLAQLMIAHNIGVSTIATYELKKIDSDYFVEERNQIGIMPRFTVATT